MFTHEPAKDVLVTLLVVVFQRAEFVSRLARTRNTGVEFGHSFVLSLCWNHRLKSPPVNMYIESMTEDKFERGILTKADREYLRAPEEYSRQASYNREEKINQRIQRAFNDFPLLATELDDSVLDELLRPERGIVTKDDDGDEIPGTTVQSETITLPYAVVFLIRAALATDRRDPLPEVGVESALSPFVGNVERGIEIWLNVHHNLTGSVDVSVTVDELQRADTLADELDELDEPLTGFERIETISQLSRAGYSTEEISELVGERPDPDETKEEREE